MNVQPVLCAICKTSVDTSAPSSTLLAKGSATINQASIARNDSIQTIPGDVVHQECRCKDCNPHQIAKSTHLEKKCQAHHSNDGPVLRLSEDGFTFKTNCFFCGRTAKLRRKRKHDVFEAKTIEIKETILKVCQEQADSWSDAGKGSHFACSWPSCSRRSVPPGLQC